MQLKTRNKDTYLIMLNCGEVAFFREIVRKMILPKQ